MTEAKRSHEEATSPLTELLATSTLHDVAKAHKTIITLQHNDTVEHALHELAKSHITSAPVVLAPSLEDNESGTYLGILDIASILNCLIDDLVGEKGDDAKWDGFLDHASEFLKRKLITILGDDVSLKYRGEHNQSLSDLIQDGFLGGSLEKGHVAHRIVVYSSRGQIVNVVSMSDVIRFINKNVDKLGDLADKSMEELGFVHAIDRAPQKLITAKVCRSLKSTHHAAMPIVDEEGRFKFSFAATDLKGLTAGKMDVLLKPVEEFVKETKQSHQHEMDTTCIRSTTLKQALHKLMSQKLHRLYIVDEKKHPIGCVSLSDILRALVEAA